MKQWIESHTPKQIIEANRARRALNRKTSKHLSMLHDERLPKRPRSALSFFFEEKWASGDMKGLPAREAMKLIASEYNGLRDNERKVSGIHCDVPFPLYWLSVYRCTSIDRVQKGNDTLRSTRQFCNSRITSMACSIRLQYLCFKVSWREGSGKVLGYVILRGQWCNGKWSIRTLRHCMLYSAHISSLRNYSNVPLWLPW